MTTVPAVSAPPDAPAPSNAAARPGALGSLRLIAADIKLAHSVFALPFAALGAFLAFEGAGISWSRFAGQLALVVACMVLARTWAMVVNRLADRRLDADNPRTSRRAFAAGRVKPAIGWLVAGLCGVGFLALAWAFFALWQNPWPMYLALPVLAWLAFYSFTKRFTALCHVVLGASLALSPIAAAIAVRPGAVVGTPSLWWLAGFVLLWVAGFDVIYALQDEEYDRGKGLASIPAAIGTMGAVWAARALHVASGAMLLAAWTSHKQLGPIFACGIGLVGLLLLVEHVALAASGRAPKARPMLQAAFFTLNGVVSLIVGAAGCVDLLN